MKIEQRPLADITPYDHNPRDNDAAIDAVDRSRGRVVSFDGFAMGG